MTMLAATPDAVRAGSPAVAVRSVTASGGPRRLVREHALLIVIVLAYALARRILWWVTGAEALAPSTPDLLNVLYWPMIGVGGVVFLSFHLVRLTFVDRGTGGILAARTWREFGREYFWSYRGASAALVIGIYAVLSQTFGPMKRAIPEIAPFSWDRTLADLDARLHGGVDAWTLLHPLVGHPFVTFFIQNVYTFGWFVALSGLVFLTVWMSDRLLRARILLVLVLSWILIGSLGAATLSSAGPAFYADVTGDPRYQPLMNYLHAVDARLPLPALEVQEMLWEGHIRGGSRELGISAMPSMHVAIAMLIALAAWAVDRRLGWVMTGFAVLIQIGSVHLAWHYAVDGYVSALGVIALWVASRGLIARLPIEPEDSGISAPMMFQPPTSSSDSSSRDSMCPRNAPASHAGPRGR